ncbi:hypothetical protein HFN63_34280 [Rhizobium leguminosarum]|uniref:hypothetical protein n=1 Tax=Rhizobium leguminosarum TaxID=384 RepID=UPI001C95FEE4|nr:hypothetical protein [Rhizobium leguminosarum]MBY5775064.1 hypothetical protein [Rhizobium leguminosarum]
MSDFMCSSDLVARASAFELFLNAPESVVTTLLQVAREAQRNEFRIDLQNSRGVIPQTEKDAATSSGASVESFAAGMSVIAVNQGRVH